MQKTRQGQQPKQAKANKKEIYKTYLSQNRTEKVFMKYIKPNEDTREIYTDLQSKWTIIKIQGKWYLFVVYV